MGLFANPYNHRQSRPVEVSLFVFTFGVPAYQRVLQREDLPAVSRFHRAYHDFDRQGWPIACETFPYAPYPQRQTQPLDAPRFPITSGGPVYHRGMQREGLAAIRSMLTTSVALSQGELF